MCEGEEKKKGIDAEVWAFCNKRNSGVTTPHEAGFRLSQTDRLLKRGCSHVVALSPFLWFEALLV